MNLKDVSIKKTIESESSSEKGAAEYMCGEGVVDVQTSASMPEDMPDWMKQGV